MRAANVLDLGCGNGVYGSILSELDRRVHGVDISEDSVERCRVLGIYDSVSVSPADRLPFDDNYFDIVFSTEVLEHIENVSSAIREVTRVLSTNGIFVLTTTLYSGSIWTYWGQSKLGYHSIGKRLHELLRYMLGFVSKKEQERFVRTWCFEPLGGHFHGFHVRQLKRLLALHGLETKRMKKFYSIKPIPLLNGGRLGYVMKKRFPINMILLPVSIAIEIANFVLQFLGVGANNIFLVASKA